MQASQSIRFLLAFAIGLSLTAVFFESTMLLFLFLITTCALFFISVTATPQKMGPKIGPTVKPRISARPPTTVPRHVTH